ncbi:MAG: hypothetical protein HW374_1135 [Bacteroidetes bacterium]|nr:hypothetical protein [Bacteroidota bacterium]
MPNQDLDKVNRICSYVTLSRSISSPLNLDKDEQLVSFATQVYIVP